MDMDIERNRSLQESIRPSFGRSFIGQSCLCTYYVLCYAMPCCVLCATVC